MRNNNYYLIPLFPINRVRNDINIIGIIDRLLCNNSKLLAQKIRMNNRMHFFRKKYNKERNIVDYYIHSYRDYKKKYLDLKNKNNKPKSIIKRIIINNKDYPLEDSSSSEEIETIDSIPNIPIRISINNLEDIIKLKDVEIKEDCKLLSLKKTIPAIQKLYNMIGMQTVKEDIFDHIIYSVECGKDHKDMLHTVITGPPGVGKTELGRIIGGIYKSLGILKKDIFKIVKRSDLIGEYLGQTAVKTQKVIDKCNGGILFIDEAYSLGNKELRDSFSKECIDTINQNLTENKNNFICIIAGYEKQLEDCFFKYNPGLRRRFNFKYKIEKYKYDELFQIFERKCSLDNFKLIDKEDIKSIFKENEDLLKFYGGDVEVIFFYCKIKYSTLVFKQKTQLNTINLEVFNESFNKFKKMRSVAKDDIQKSIKYMMYI